MLGATNGTPAGSEAAIELAVPLAAKPLMNAVFAMEASEDWLPATAGESGAGPTVKVLSSGVLVMNPSTTKAGNWSMKIPTPPRITVFLLAPSGVHANPTRGCQLMLSKLVRA